MKRVDWSVEEMVAMVDLYYKYKDSPNLALKKALLLLSQKLNKRADIFGIEHDEKFRNYNGMKMIFENIRYIDTSGEKGLSCTSQLMQGVVDLYHNNSYIFNKIISEFNIKYGAISF